MIQNINLVRIFMSPDDESLTENFSTKVKLSNKHSHYEV